MLFRSFTFLASDTNSGPNDEVFGATKNDKVGDASSGEDILASAQATCRLQATARW